jgi:HSP20 family protein
LLTSGGKENSADQSKAPDVWHSFRSEMDRLFDRFVFGRCGGCSTRNLRGGRQLIPNFSTLAIDMHEDEKAYSISSELPGIDAKDIDVSYPTARWC